MNRMIEVIDSTAERPMPKKRAFMKLMRVPSGIRWKGSNGLMSIFFSL